MLPVSSQIDQGKLVCPRTHERLLVASEELWTESRRYSYPFRGGVPFLIADPVRQEQYRQECRETMYVEYAHAGRASAKQRLRSWLFSTRDYRSQASVDAFQRVIADQPQEALCVSVGGGPTRAHPNLVNLNIDSFENVDVVGDAYTLPYADGSVDAIHCEAVLEHLEDPQRAVAEMLRVLKPAGQIFAATPFLQAFHAYPNHFQNFTLEGHNRLFQRAGFELLASGTCVGPTFALTDLTALYLRSYIPGRCLSRLSAAAAHLVARAVRPLDRHLNRGPQSHVLASTVFAHLRKP